MENQPPSSCFMALNSHRCIDMTKDHRGTQPDVGVDIPGGNISLEFLKKNFCAPNEKL